MPEVSKDDDPDVRLAVLEHRVKAIESELSSVKAWGFKAALGVLGTIVLTYWDKFQSLLKAAK